MKKRLMVIGIVLVLLLTMSTTVNAKVEREPFVAVGITLEILNPGKVFLSDGNMHIRGMVERVRTECDDDRIEGWHTIIANNNLNAEEYGRVWGTYDLAVDAYDGGWEGTMTGVTDENGISLKMQGHGYGELSGLKIEGTYLNGITSGVIVASPND